MSEVREITKAERPPLHSNHVLVERTRQGTGVVSGTAVREDDAAHVSLPHFELGSCSASVIFGRLSGARLAGSNFSRCSTTFASFAA